MDGRAYCRALGEALEVLIEDADDPLAAMNELARAAERGALIDSDSLPRRDSAAAFVMDLLTENPIAGDWMSARLLFMPRPRNLSEIAQIAEYLR